MMPFSKEFFQSRVRVDALALIGGILFVASPLFLIPDRISVSQLPDAFVALLALASVFLSLFVTTHELGHILAAKIVRFKIACIRLYPFVIDLTGKKPQFNLDFRLIEEMNSVASLASVGTNGHDLTGKYLFLCAAGPIADLVVLLLAVAGFLAATDAVGVWLQFVARGALIASFWAFLLNWTLRPQSDLGKI